MNYSFSVTADTKDDAGEKVEAELGKVVAAQPIHAADRQAAQDAAEAFINTLGDPKEGECITVYVSGSVSWTGTIEEAISAGSFIGAGVNVSASISKKAA